MSSETLTQTTCSCDKSLCRIIMDSQPGNIVSAAMIDELQERLEKATENPHLKLITLEGAGKHFSFGASVEEHTKERVAEMLPNLRKLITTIAASPVPVAALVQGCCYGGAAEIVFACHFIFAASNARVALPEIKLGVFPPYAAALLPRLTGQAVADRTLLSGQDVNAEELYASGIATQVFASDNLLKGLKAWFEGTLATYSASSLRHATQASRRVFLKDLTKDLFGLENAYLTKLMDTHDANEGIEAFIQKRSPQWRNQ